MYSSPTVRTLSTAAGLATKLGSSASTIIPAYGLNCCAAAQTYGVAKAFPKDHPDDKTMGGKTLACWPPLGNPEEVDRRQSRGRGGSFVTAVKELAASHREGDLLVMVTHRECIWEAQRHVGQKPKSEYCNISSFAYHLSTGNLAHWDLSTRGVARKASSQMAPWVDIALDSAADIALDSVADVLASGTGMVTIQRGGRGGCTSTRLWKTPGVRGVWVENGEVPDGEVVQLMSSPQPSEGEGDFVLVQRPNGVQGWTKVKNIQLRT